MIEVSKVEEIIRKHKDCRKPHLVRDGIYLSCLVLVLAEVKGQDPVTVAKEMSVI